MGPKPTGLLAGVSLLAAGVYGILGPRINPSVALSLPMRVDLVALVAVGLLGMSGTAKRSRTTSGAVGLGGPGLGATGSGATGEGTIGLGEPGLGAAGSGGPGLRARVYWIVSGGLLGAAFLAPWISLPWLLAPALVLAWAGGGYRPGRGERRRAGDRAGRFTAGPRSHRTTLLQSPRPSLVTPSLRVGSRRKTAHRSSGFALALLAGLMNCSLVAVTSAYGFRISPGEFEAMDLRANQLLADVPLHDVWAVDLKGDPAPTLDDLGDALRRISPLQSTPAMMALGGIREAAVQALGLDDPRWWEEDASFLHRLTSFDRRESTSEPGTRHGIWNVLFAFSREGAVETMNGTVHVAVGAAIGENPDGSRLFLSFRVREVNWTTSYYMRLIDPARRFFLYPPLLRQFAHTWEREGRSSP